MKLIVVLVLFTGGLCLASCTDDQVVGPSGEIVGFVSLRDETGLRLLDAHGASIRLRGTSHTATSDSSGKWRMANVPAGIYNIDISRTGFASNQVRAFQFVGGGTAYLPSVTELILSRRDTFLLQQLAFLPDYHYTLLDTLIETDTGWIRPYDSTEIPDRFIYLKGTVNFESDTQQSSVLYIRPHFTDLSIVPSVNYAIGEVKKGQNELKLSVQFPFQYGYPRGVPVEIILTTRQNNTYYFEPDTRKRIVTDPHDLLRFTVTLPKE